MIFCEEEGGKKKEFERRMESEGGKPSFPVGFFLFFVTLRK